MAVPCSLTAGNSKYRVSMLDAVTYLYIARPSVLVFARHFSISTKIVAGLFIGLCLGFLLIYSIVSINNICWDGLFLLAGVALFFYITLLYHPEYISRYKDELNEGKFGFKSIYAYGAGIYLYYLIRLYKGNAEKLNKVFVAVAYTIAICEIWLILERESEYRMGFGYQMEFAAMVFIAQYLSDAKNKHYFVLSVFCMGLGILYGSRACIIGYVVFIFAYMLWRERLTLRKAVLIILALVAAAIYSSQSMMLMIYNFFAKLGFRSRTLYYIAMGDILSVDRARQIYIWPVLIEELKKMPLYKMYGAFGDRYLLGSNVTYAHNFVLEILLTFGYIIGGGFLLWMFIRFWRVLKCNKNTDGLLTLLFGCFSLCKLFFSSSFWMEPYFWAFLAMLVNCNVRPVREKIENHIPQWSNLA